jgi:hypothetical protein
MRKFATGNRKTDKKPFYGWQMVCFVSIGLCFLSGCGKDNEASQSQLGTTTPEASAEQATQSEAGDFGAQQQAYQKAKDEALGNAQKAYEARTHGTPLPPSLFRFPNTPEPEQGIPDYLNFYSINDDYPTYLLCQYQIRKTNYNQSDEVGWIKESLEQIRQSGPTNFPPLQWAAVIIVNSADWENGSTFEQAYKVGAIFKASDVFNPSCELSQLVAHADIDRHPFKYDTTRPTPGEQHRWLIVEQHAATNNPATGPN